jgi:L-amino acid N-acyltransferase YncA
MAPTLDRMEESCWPAVRAIYQEGMRGGNATFETEAPEWEAWDRGHLRSCRFIARDGEEIVGWAALSPVSSRCVYEGVAEVSVYVATGHQGKGIGAMLLAALVEESEREGIWTLQAGIFPENGASVAIHERAGFRQIGRRERIGRQNGVWRDTLLLERRSRIVGVE